MYVVKNDKDEIIAYSNEPQENSVLMADDDEKILQFKAKMTAKFSKRQNKKSASDILLKHYAQQLKDAGNLNKEISDACDALLEE